MTNWVRWLGAGLVVAAALGLCGCPSGHQHDTGKAKGGEEEHESPHGGELFADPGHKYHAELKVDRAGKQATVWLLDGQAKKNVPTKAKTVTVSVKDAATVQIVLEPKPEDKDPAGSASRFVGTHDRLGEPLDLEKVEIRAEVAGKPYVFKLDEH
jgi:hypothetical protein